MGIQTRIHNVLIDKKILVVSNTILGLWWMDQLAYINHM